MEETKKEVKTDMKIILIGEDHENSIARELVKKIIEKSQEGKIKFLIELEPNDYEIIKKDVMNHVVPKDKCFISLFEIIKNINLNNAHNIIPIDIPINKLLCGAWQKIHQKNINTQEEILNEIILSEWENLKCALDFFFQNKNSGSLYKLIEDTTTPEKVRSIINDFKGKMREEFYKTKRMQEIRNQYFFKKAHQEIEKNDIDILIILVGSNHFGFLYQEVEKYKNVTSLNQPRPEQIDKFLSGIFDQGKESIELPFTTDQFNKVKLFFENHKKENDNKVIFEFDKNEFNNFEKQNCYIQ